MSETYAKYPKYIDYLRAEKVGADIVVNFKMPIPTQNGITFPGQQGKLLWAFDDGLVVRTAEGEAFFSFDQLSYFDFPSAIKTAATGLGNIQAPARA